MFLRDVAKGIRNDVFTLSEKVKNVLVKNDEKKGTIKSGEDTEINLSCEIISRKISEANVLSEKNNISGRISTEKFSQF